MIKDYNNLFSLYYNNCTYNENKNGQYKQGKGLNYLIFNTYGFSHVQLGVGRNLPSTLKREIIIRAYKIYLPPTPREVKKGFVC